MSRLKHEPHILNAVEIPVDAGFLIAVSDARQKGE
jgi:hypothetical protein